MAGFYAVVTILTFCYGVSVQAKEYYTIVAPRVLRPNTEYHVAVSTLGVSEPTTVVVAVGGKQDSGGTFKTNQFVTVEPYVSRIVKLEIGDVGPGSYNLTAEGTGGMNFFNSTELEYIHKSYSVFIQTDKAIYKPGHKVQFRAVVLNSHLKPSVTGALDIHITDGKGNRVKQWNRALTTRGVFSGELELSKNPVLGDWNITVNVLDQVFHKNFQVAEYVLPKFEVTIDVPKHATFKDSIVVATIRAKYTYGRAVKGEATVSVHPNYFSGVIQPIFQPPVRKVFPIDGKANVEIDIVKELKLTDEYERSIQFDVAVEEALTGRRQNITAQTMLHKHKYKMELIKTSEHFKPGLKYTAFIKLSHHDGRPVQDKTNPVKVRHGFSYNTDEFTETKYKLNSNGMIELVYYPPAHNVTTLGIEADYLDLKEWFSTVAASLSPSDSFIQAVIKTEKPTVNQDIEIEVNSTGPLKYITYQVLGRGDVIVAGTVPVQGDNQHVANFRFLATYAMAPTAHVIVQFVRDDGEVVADALDIELDGVFQNYVNVVANPLEAEPGGNVDLNFEAKPNSYIGLLGVDQSVLLLKGGNDIEQDDVLDEMRSYDQSESSQFLPLMKGTREERSTYWWPGSFTAKEAYEKSGALIMTNGYVNDHNPFRQYGSSNLHASNRPHNRPIPAPGLPALKPDIGPPVVFRPVTRPPLAGPYAFSRIPIPVWNKPRVFLPHDIADTWLFANISSGSDGKASLRRSVPDTITSWVITAFSVDPLYGLGLIEKPSKVRVFRPFFVSLDLPYSVIRGEIVAIPVVVFNYMDKDVIADVTLENAGQFDFADYSNDVNDSPRLELYRRKKLVVPANIGASTAFMITPKELGYISIKVTANSNIAGDAVERKLLVKAEGETQYLNKAIFIDLRNTKSFSTNVTLDIPVNVVPGSELIEVSAVGDMLGPSIPNLASLIKMPFGCGEQNMLNFVPNIVIIDYLKNTNQLTQAIENRATRFLETGYQQELTYRHSDGSFSAFGSSDRSGSTWLTAFVAKSFRQAMTHINVEEKIIMDALQWLASNQASNGSFPEVGQVSHKDMQGGSAKGLALTAYTLTAFLENAKATPVYRNSINKGLDYIVKNLNGLEDPYAIAICAYTLQLAQHPVAEIAFNLLEAKANTTDEMKWWRQSLTESEKKNPWTNVPNSVNVEMTSYSLLTYLKKGLVEDAFPIVRWLISQQNDKGGFASTQDTVVAMAALAKMAEKITSPDVDVSVLFTYNKGISNTIKVNQANAMILQKQEIPRKVRQVEINATGNGFAIVQVSYRFNVNVTGAWPLFTLDPQVDKNSNRNHLQLSICSGFVGGNESNMAVMEVSLPSGFTVDSDALPSLQLSQNVKRVETKDGDTVVMLYFDKMTKKEFCPTVSAFRTHKVALQKPVPVSIYDYYDQSRRARVFYEPRVATLCDICEGEDCGKVCTKLSSQERDDTKGTASNLCATTTALLVLLVLRFI